MTNKEAVEMMKAKLECMTREVSGTDRDCNAKKCDDCDLCYAQGNIGEQKEWLSMGIKALENQRIGHWIEQENGNMLTYHRYKCSVCGGKRTGETGSWIQIHECKYPYCPDCGAKMKGETE